MSTNSLKILQTTYPGSVLLSIKQSALSLSKETQTLRNELSAKTITLKTIKQGNRRLIHIEELARYIDSLAARAVGGKKRGRPRNVPGFNVGGATK